MKINPLKELCIGYLINSGYSRNVYLCKLNPELVFKISKNTQEDWAIPTQNCIEYMIWDRYKNDEKTSKYLAPCYSISSCGTILIQKRTTPISENEFNKFKEKNKIPTFLCDLKQENCGWYNNNIVFHDYGLFSTDSTLIEFGDE